MSSVNLHPGISNELGAHFFSQHPHHEGLHGVQFALCAPRAHAVELCLFDDDDREVKISIPNTQPYKQNDVWRVFIANVNIGQKYGYRVHGEWNPQAGKRHNPAKLLIDPYARKLQGDIKWDNALYDYERGKKNEWLISDQNSAAFVPKSVVTSDDFNWEGIQSPRHAMARSIIYELNVRGFTMQHPDVPDALRGTYLGLCQPAIIDYLKELGITAVELLPVTSFASESRLQLRRWITIGVITLWR